MNVVVVAVVFVVAVVVVASSEMLGIVFLQDETQLAERFFAWRVCHSAI